MKIPLRGRGYASGKKNKPISRKPKIRWQQLGLTDPAEKQGSTPIEEIRRQVATLSSRGLGQGVRSRLDARGSQSTDVTERADGGRKRRRGATE